MSDNLDRGQNAIASHSLEFGAGHIYKQSGQRFSTDASAVPMCAPQIMGTSVTTTAAGDNLVVVNTEGRLGRSKVFYGTSATNDATTKMEKIPLTSGMTEAREVKRISKPT